MDAVDCRPRARPRANLQNAALLFRREGLYAQAGAAVAELGTSGLGRAVPGAVGRAVGRDMDGDGRSPRAWPWCLPVALPEALPWRGHVGRRALRLTRVPGRGPGAPHR